LCSAESRSGQQSRFIRRRASLTQTPASEGQQLKLRIPYSTKTCSCEGANKLCRPPRQVLRFRQTRASGRLLVHRLTIGAAAALALARVLALAAVVAALAAALALARVLALTGMLVFLALFVLLFSVLLALREKVRRRDGAGSREQARDGRTSDQCLVEFRHIALSLLLI